MKPLPITLAAAALLAAGCSEKKDAAGAGKPGGMPPAPVTMGTVQQKDMPLEVRTFGNVEPIATVGIKAQVSGELIDVSFTEGQEVEKGKLLFTIQPRLFATQLAQAQANLERDRALALAAAQNLKRQEELEAKGSGVKDELEKARAQAASTAATVKADEALVLIAETQLNYTTIESPIAGRTGAIRLRPGNLIRNTDDVPLTTVVQLDPIYVAFALPEQHLDAIRTGMQDKEKPLPVTVRDPRDGRTLGEGKLVFIANTVDTTTGTVALKAEFTNKDRLLFPGAFVDVSLRLATEPGALVVPSSALTMSQQGPRVLLVKDDMTTESRIVTVTRTAGQESIIKDGPPPGAKIVTGGQSRVLPGGKVVPVPPAVEKPAAPPAPAGTPAGKPAASREGPRAGEFQVEGREAGARIGLIGPISPAPLEAPTLMVASASPQGNNRALAGYAVLTRRAATSTTPGTPPNPAAA
jgi:multidrug efflux system membrane fusion protein